MNNNNFRSFNHIIVLLCICACVVFMFQFQSCCNNKSHTSTFSIVSGNHEESEPPMFSFDLPYVEQNLNSLDQANPHLINYARVKYLTPPSTLPYNLKANTSEKTKTPLADWVLKFYGDKRDGIFLEAGANDGEMNSNTLYLEKELGWTGLLIECNPQLAPHILTKHRKAWVADVCLAPKSTPGTFNFSLPDGYDVAGTIGKPLASDVNRPKSTFDVQAMPLYTLLAALGWQEIDFFSFDIEGVELELIRNFPFDKVIFKLIIVEIHYYNAEQKEEMKAIFEKNDYVFVQALHIDHVYVHKSVKHLIPK